MDNNGYIMKVEHDYTKESLKIKKIMNELLMKRKITLIC